MNKLKFPTYFEHFDAYYWFTPKIWCALNKNIEQEKISYGVIIEGVLGVSHSAFNALYVQVG